MAMPNGALLWQDFSWQSIQQAIRHNPEVELAKIEGWQPSDTFRMNPTVMRLALRHGVACSGGIVFDGGLVSAEDRPGLLRRTHAEANAAHAKLPQWAQHPELDAKVDQSVRLAISKAVDELNAELAAPVNHALVGHWRRLGGVVPDPL